MNTKSLRKPISLASVAVLFLAFQVRANFECSSFYDKDIISIATALKGVDLGDLKTESGGGLLALKQQLKENPGWESIAP